MQAVTTRELAQVRERIKSNTEFQRTVLVGALAQHKSAQLWMLGSLDTETNAHFKQLVAEFSGVPYGRALQGLRAEETELTRLP